MDEEFGPAHASFGALLTFKRRYDAALVAFNRAISLGSEDAFWGLGLLHRFLGQHEKAIEAFRRAIAVDPLVLPIRYQLAETHYCAGNYQAAIDGFETYFSPGEIVTRTRIAEAYRSSSEAVGHS